MRTLLIDDSGTLADSASPALRADLQALGTGSDFTDYCIRNLGFVAVASNDASVHIRLRPSVVAPIAFAGLMYWLGENMGKRVLLSVLDSEWSHRMLASTRNVMPELTKLIQTAQINNSEDFLSCARDPLGLPDSHPFKALVRLHKELAHAFTNNQKSALFTIADERLRGRYLITTADANLTNIVVDHAGDGHSQQANYWLQRGIGQRLSDLADVSYGHWATQAHFETAQDGQVRLDDIDIVVMWPTLGRQRYRHQRLLLPLQKDASGHAVLCATLADSGIDLRRKIV